METRHQNIVQFIGYCAESTFELMKQPNGNFIWAEIPKRLLCFEYVCNKSLDKYISDESSGLEWNIRYKLIKGICSGLQFLHDKCRIVHLDLKPENILMDSMMMPKITDFGLSRIFGEQQTRIVTAKPAGTRGYMAPEYLLQGVVSSKADIFSLGVIVIEIITGRRDYPLFQQDSPHSTATSCQHFVEKMEAGEELPFEMQCKDRLLVLHTTISKELIPHSNSEDMFGKETDGKVGDVKKQQEGWSPTTPLSESSTCTQNHKQAMKESSTPEQANEKTNEMEAHEELTSNTLYTDKLLVQNTACKDLTPLSVTEDMFNYRIDGKVVDETTCEGFSPAPLLELSTNNQNYQEEEKESSKPQVASGTTPKIIAICSKLLDVHPPELNFPVEPNKLVTCSLHLTNRNNNQVVFRLMEKRYNWMCFLKLPLYGIVPPRSTYTLVVTTDKRGSLPTEREVDLILQTVISNEYITPYKRGHEWDNYFEKAKKVEKAVHTVPLKAIYSQKGKMSCEVEACEELPLDMQCTDKLVVNTLTNDLAPHSELVDEVKSDRGLSPTHLWESSIHNQNCLEGAQSAHDITTEIEMEAPEELPSDMQYTDKLLVLNTTKCKDLTMPSVTEDLFKNEIDGKVVDETSSQLSRKTCSRTHLLESSTVSQNYQEEVKATSEPQLASDTTAEVEACEEFPLDRQCTNKLVVSTASKDLAPHSVTEDLFINKTDGKLVGEVTSDEVVGAPGLRRRVRVCPLPNNQQVQRHQAPSSPVAPVLLCESNIGNGNYPEGAKDSNETHSAHDTTTETEVRC
uniref:Protein kinase domain-containing protein n=1 Tax=Aegilops tauschii subsp. strangulata TaxID=200361 RepID=A0A453T9V9_AEGTS